VLGSTCAGGSKGGAGPRLVNLGASQGCENFSLTKPKLFLAESRSLRKVMLIRDTSKFMNSLPAVCCVIVSDQDNRILLIKRGRDPYLNKWSLISGIGYIKKGKTPEEGVVDEVVGDVSALPTNIKNLFSIYSDSQKVIVFSAQVNKEKTIIASPHVTDLKWCTEDELGNFDDLAFDHGEILKKYLSTRDIPHK
jgi:ADP-ribose pyrophosphatase YjhB (NUDIX family)